MNTANACLVRHSLCVAVRCWCRPQLVQSRIDENGGEWLQLRADEDVHEWFGDPHPGSSKVLRLQFEVYSKTGDVIVTVRWHSRLCARALLFPSRELSQRESRCAFRFACTNVPCAATHRRRTAG